jgi:16S rRNA (guanine966-N2)-methyltransferase
LKVSTRNLAEATHMIEKLARSADKREAFKNRKPAHKTLQHSTSSIPAAPDQAAKPSKQALQAAAKLQTALQRPANEVRLIGGQWKRTKLAVANLPGLRPTPDRVRETLFNWLGQDMTGMRCVDAFAGTGALGFEAASRGAADVLLVEPEARLIAQLQTLKTKLKADMVRIQRGDGIAILLALPRGSVDVVFIDPPFNAPIFDKALAAAAHAVSDQGAVYLEAPKAWTNEDLASVGLQVSRAGRAGAVHYHLLCAVAA